MIRVVVVVVVVVLTTVNPNVADLLMPPPVAIIITLYVPAAIDEGVEIVSVKLQVGVQLTGA